MIQRVILTIYKVNVRDCDALEKMLMISLSFVVLKQMEQSHYLFRDTRAYDC